MLKFLFRKFNGGLDPEMAEPSSVRKFNTIAITLMVVIISAVLFGVNHFGLLEPESTTSQRVNVSGADRAGLAKTNFATERPEYFLPNSIKKVGNLPKYVAVPNNATQVGVYMIPWQGPGVPYAGWLGGAETSEGSLAHQAGSYAKVTVLEEPSDILDRLVTGAERAFNGKVSDSDCHIVYIMANYTPTYARLINIRLKSLREASLKKYGHDGGFWAKGVHAPGESYGEDSIWGLEPELLPGACVTVYPLDGNDDVLQRYLQKKGYEVNVQQGIYMKHAVNVIHSDNFVRSARMVMLREKVGPLRIYDVNGNYTGDDTTVVPTIMSSWSPQDRAFYEWFAKLGINSYRYTGTEEFRVMPAIGITLERYINPQVDGNIRDELEQIMEGCYRVSEQVRFHEDRALTYIGEAESYLLGQETPQYWKEMYRGKEVEQGNGRMARVGGSRVLSIHEAAYNFGIMDENGNITTNPDIARSAFGVIYQTNAEIMSTLYPKDLPADEVVPLNDLFDPSLMIVVANNMRGSIQPRETYSYNLDSGYRLEDVGTSKWYFQFPNNSAEFQMTGENLREFERLCGSMMETPDFVAMLVGYTDNTGDRNYNLQLSKDRADFLKKQMVTSGYRIDPDRINTDGKGASGYIASNLTSEGRGLNRRVEVTFKRKVRN